MPFAFTAPQEALHGALRAAGRAVAARPLQPVLGGLLVRAEGSLVTVEGYDLSVGVAVSLPAAVEQAGAAVVPAHPTLELLGKLPPGSTVSLALGSDGALSIAASGASFRVPGAAPAEDWPGLPAMDDGHDLELPIAALQEALGAVSHAVAPEGEGKGAAEGVSAVLGASGLRLLACDGRRASQALLPALGGDWEFDVVLPRALAREIERLPADAEAMARIAVDAGGRMIAVEVDGLRVVGNLLEGTYPPVASLMTPGAAAKWIEVGAGDLTAALERAAVFGPAATLTIADDVLAVAVEGDTGSGGERVAVDGSGADVALIANPKLVLDGLKALGALRVELCYTSPAAPVLLRPAGGGFRTYLIMPIAKQEKA